MNYNSIRNGVFYRFGNTLAKLHLLADVNEFVAFSTSSRRIRVKANKGEYMNWSRKEFKEKFTRYVGDNNANAFMGMKKMQNWEWVCCYGMYKCGSSLERIFDVLIEGVYNE